MFPGGVTPALTLPRGAAHDVLLVAAITSISIYNTVHRLKLYITTRINSEGAALASPLTISALSPLLIKHQNRGSDKAQISALPA